MFMLYTDSYSASLGEGVGMAQQLLSILLQEKNYNNKYSHFLLTRQKCIERSHIFESTATNVAK